MGWCVCAVIFGTWRSGCLTHVSFPTYTELNHAQSREIRQHESRTNSALHTVMSRTAAGLTSAAATIRSAAYRPVAQNNLDEFGIPSTSSDPLLEEQHQEQEFVLLRPFKLLQRDGWGLVSNLDLFFTVRVIKSLFASVELILTCNTLSLCITTIIIEDLLQS